MLIGILALQGGFEAHAKTLAKLNIDFTLVKKPQDLENIDGLIIPGGESTTLIKLMGPLLDPLQEFYKSKKPILTTCAGTILVATEVTHPQQTSLNWMDITVKRNAYGRQIDSFITEGSCNLPNKDNNSSLIPMTFIRAPQITRVGSNVEVLATHNEQPVLVKENHLIAATFHPELNSDTTVHSHFISLI